MDESEAESSVGEKHKEESKMTLSIQERDHWLIVICGGKMISHHGNHQSQKSILGWKTESNKDALTSQTA